MSNPLSTFRAYFRFTHNEPPSESQLNAGLVDKIDTDMNTAIAQASQNQSDIAALKTRVDAHADGAGNLTQASPEFTVFVGTPTYISAAQFSVVGNFTNEFTVNRSVKAVLVGSQPTSDVQSATYDGGLNKTTIVLYDSILDATLSQVKLGFVKESLPRIAIADLAFDPATQAELDAHKSSSDHDSRYPRKDDSGQQTIIGNFRVAKSGEARLEGEDTSQATGAFGLGRIAQVAQTFILRILKRDGSATLDFLTLDGGNSKMIAGQPLDMNSKALINLPVPSAAGDAARKADIPTVGGAPAAQGFGDAAVNGSSGVAADRDHKHATLPVKVWIPAAGTNNTSAASIYDLPASNAPVANAYGTSPNKFGALDFADGASALTSQFAIRLPDDWSNTGGIDIRFIWFSGSTSTNSVVWTVATASVADGEDVLAPTFNATQTVAKANNATANTRNSATITGVTTTGMAAGELAIFRVGRDPTNGSDTLAATASLIGVEITYRRQ